MNEKKNISTLIFDYDGTIHNGLKVYAPAFRLAFNYLIELGYLTPDSRISDKEIGSWLGYSSMDTWNKFMPELPPEVKDVCSNMITEAMLAYVRLGRAELYPGSLNMLKELKDAGYDLVFLSNCRRAYMEAHIRNFRLKDFFGGFYCTQDFAFKPKYEIFEIIRDKHQGDFAIIGDRFHDMEVARKHDIFSVGCTYGYGADGELDDADVTVDDVSEISKVFIG